MEILSDAIELMSKITKASSNSMSTLPLIHPGASFNPVTFSSKIEVKAREIRTSDQRTITVKVKRATQRWKQRWLMDLLEGIDRMIRWREENILHINFQERVILLSILKRRQLLMN